MKLKITPGIEEIGGCIYKLTNGNKFVIVKAKNLLSSLYLIEKGYFYFLHGGRNNKKKGHKEWEGKNSFYYQFYKHLSRNRSNTTDIEVLFESENALELLKKEQTLLDEHIKDKNCLNSNVIAYIPKYRESTGSYGWISKEEHQIFFAWYNSTNEKQ